MNLNREAKKELLGKKILIVDDEKDVLEQLTEILSEAKIHTASSYEEALSYLEKFSYDIAVLDIMGVRGYDLLNICTQKNIPAIMLTGKAITREDLLKSLKNGAILFLPKQEMKQLDLFVAEIIASRKQDKSLWKVWQERLDLFLKRLLGINYRDEHKDLWDKLIKE